MKKDLKTVGIAVAVSGVMSVSVAGAATLITGANVKNGSLTGLDIKEGSIPLHDLSEGTQHLIATHGKDGTSGANGVNGQNGGAGAKGDSGAQGAQGAQGGKGDTGATGAKGDKGDKGDTGTQGVQGVQGVQGDQGPALPEDFSVTSTNETSTDGYDYTNPVSLTSAGLKFGPFADGGHQGASVRYDGANGMKLSDLTKLIFTAKYSTDDDNTVGVPYLRVFLNDDSSTVIFSPNTQPTPDIAEDVFHTWDVTSGTVRYGDDTGNGPESAWSDVVDEHGDDIVSAIKVSAGFSAGKNLRVFLRDLTVNDKAFTFGS